MTQLHHHRAVTVALSWICILSLSGCSSDLGSAIFIHPDGSSAAHWGAVRLVVDGPDGMLNWDRMDHMGLYRGHQTNSLGASSNGGATIHAYGVKVPYHSYGMYEDQP
ncbi:MAG: alkaline phosphatase, partial [Rhodothermia bacterium]|nr:alkaline phosphatase [Rhodothermia bacterium]